MDHTSTFKPGLPGRVKPAQATALGQTAQLVKSRIAVIDVTTPRSVTRRGRCILATGGPFFCLQSAGNFWSQRLPYVIRIGDWEPCFRINPPYRRSWTEGAILRV